MKNFIRILLSNWIHIVILFLLTFLYIFLYLAFTANSEMSFLDLLVAGTAQTVGLLLGYGLYFLIGFIIYLIIFDFANALLFKVSSRKSRFSISLLVQWLMPSAIFSYYAIIYDYWLWFLFIISFLVSQLLRYRILKHRYFPFNQKIGHLS
jgi:hypothetical protein